MPGGYSIDYDLDAVGAVAAIREMGQTFGAGVLARFSYDNLGRRTKLTRGNGSVTNYGYDNAARLASLGQDLAGTGNDDTVSFSYNEADQILGRTSTNTAYDWAAPSSFSRSYGVNGLNQLTQAGTLSIGHDGRGNIASIGGDTFQYDHANRMTGASRAGVNVTLGYDALDRLYQVGGTRFLYDGADLIAEYNSSGSLLRRFVHGPAEDEPIVWYEGTGTGNRRWLHPDERGSIVAVSDGTGNAIGINRYDEYGVPASTNIGRFQYTGQMWLPELGLYHYKARMYWPEGRFMQPDPIGYDDGMNIYAYVGNDPVSFTDPSGMGGELNGSGSKCAQTGCSVEEIVITALTRSGDIVVTAARHVISAADYIRDMSIWGQQVRDWTLDLPRVAVQYIASQASGELIPQRNLSRFPKVPKWKGSCGCFEGGTLVVTPEGLVPIETIEVGDLVLAQNEATGEIAPKPVTDLIRPEPKLLYALKLRDASGDIETFHATDDHPWKVEGKGWVETRNLRPRDRIDTASGEDMVVLSRVLTDRVEHTYNLTVADWHTFLVGEDQAVVHNASLPCRAAALASKLRHNQVFIRGAGGKVYAYDLAGRAHFDKGTQAFIATPHMKEGQIHTGPNGRTSTAWGAVRGMTEADLRTVTNYLGR